jgi:NADP-dependent 3-hydroxy acid dehydrogenase YdfG
MQELKDKVVVITGGSVGFGKEMGNQFYKAGAKVVITGTNKERLLRAQSEIGQIDTMESDVTSPDDWEKLHQYVTGKYSRIDILVNNAGGGIAVKETVEQTIEDIDKIISLNLSGVVYGSRIFGKTMKEQKLGTIINLSSVCAYEAWPNLTVYAAAKAGVVALSKGLYVELRPYNVRVTAVSPGAGRTHFSKNAGIPEPPLPYKLEPIDLAEAVLHVCRMPQHIFIEEYRIWGTDQEIIPL